MKTAGENKSIKKLAILRDSFRAEIEGTYEPAAKNCLTCEVQGSCCTDAHFVNVHISRLDAVAIGNAVNDRDPVLRSRVIERNAAAIAGLGRDFEATYSCPLFEPGVGCLVHTTAKPLPCINHACYENEADLPPSSLLEKAEKKIERLNDAVYRSNWNWLPIPVWLKKIL